MTDSMPLVPSALQTGDAFFSSQKSQWVDDSAGPPPSGAWQLAPSIANKFAVGGSVFGEAVYSSQDRNLTSTSAPVVSGLMCFAKDRASAKLQAGDLVVVTNTSFQKKVHSLQRVSLSAVDDISSNVAVVAAYHTLSTQMSATSAVSVSLICCGQIKLKVKDVERLVAGFFSDGNKLPGDTFTIGNKQFIILTPVQQTTHEMRCMMGAYE